MEADKPEIRGLRLIERTESVGSGEVWRARMTGGLAGERGEPLPGELAGVGECYVRLLRLPVEEAMREKARIVAADLLALDDPGLVAIRAVQPAFDGLALVFGALPAPLVPLPELARRRQLSAGEIVTLGVGLAWALAAAHDAGFAHGRLRDADVLLDPAGRPLLAGVGVMAVLGAGGDPGEDAVTLPRLLGSLLDHESPGARRVLAALGEPAGDVRALAARLADAAPAAPMDLGERPGAAGDEGAEEPETTRGRVRDGRFRLRAGGLLAGIFGGGGRPSRRGLRLAGAAAGILVLAGVIGWVSAPARERAGASASAPSAQAPGGPGIDWAAQLATLDAAWAAAFERADPALLEAVDAPGSSAFRQDVAQLQALRARGLHAFGLRFDVARVTVRTAAADRMVLLVVDGRRPYQIRDSRERVVETVAERSRTAHLVTLRDVGKAGRAQWRIDAVSDPVAAS